MKKFLMLIAAMLCVLCGALAFAACDIGTNTGNTGNGGTQTEQPGGQTPGGEEKPHVHSFVDYYYNEDATCTENGTETAFCSCGESDTRTKAGSALGHAFETYTSNEDATCTENGTETATCTRCGEQDTREVKDSALGHDWDEGQITKPATCMTAGQKYFTCNRDPEHHKREQIEIDPSAHGYGDWIDQIDAECEKDGVLGHFECEYCHENFDEAYAPLDSLKIEQLGHDWDDGKITTPSTCTTAGEKYFTCNHNPEHHKTEEIKIDPTAHEYGEWIPQIDAKCTEEGTLGHFECEYCHSNFDDDHEPLNDLKIEKIPHEYNEWQDEIPTSCTAPGRRGYQECKNCHLKYDREDVLIEEDDLTIAQIDHKYEFDHVVTKTCQEAGYAVEKCSMCQKSRNIKIRDIDVSLVEKSIGWYNGRITEVSYLASLGLFGGGYGTLYYKWELFSSETSSIPVLTNPFTENNLYTVSTRDYSTGLNGYVVQVTVKDNYSNYAICRYIIGESSRSTLVEVFEGEHDFQNDFCTRCKKQESSVGLVYIPSGDHYTVAGLGTCTEKKVVIASVYGGLPVTEIGDAAFRNQDNIISVRIPNSITKIGKEAFYDCDALTEVTIPDSATEMGDHVFYSCDSLQKVSWGSGLKSIPAYTFHSCKKLFDFTILDGVTSIGEYAFYSCWTLTSVTIPASVKSIGSNAYGVNNLKEVIFAPNSELTSIGSYAFNDCEFPEIIIPRSVTSIGYHAFYSCDSLVSVTFEDPTGWWVSTSSYATSGTDLEETQLQEGSIAAVFLTKTYVDDYWKKKV